MSVSFILTVEDSGVVTLDKCEEGWLDFRRDDSFTKANMGLNDALDLHVKTYEPTRNIDHARLVRVTVEDDTIPKFGSIEEAEAWMESRKGLTIL